MEGLRAMEKLLRFPTMRERFQATCLSRADETKLFDTWSFSLKSLRWEAIEEFCRHLLLLEKPIRKYWQKDKFVQGIKGTKYKPVVSAGQSFEYTGVSVEAVDLAVCSDTFWAGCRVVQSISFSAEYVGRWSEGCRCCEHSLISNQNSQRRRTKWRDHVNESTPCPFRGCRAVEIAAGDWLPRLTTVLQEGQKEMTESIAKAGSDDRAVLLDDLVKARAKLWGQLRIKLAYFSHLPWKLCALAWLSSIVFLLLLFRNHFFSWLFPRRFSA